MIARRGGYTRGAFDNLDYILTGIEGESGRAHELRSDGSGEDADHTVRWVRKAESGLGMLVVMANPAGRFDPEVHDLVL